MSQPETAADAARMQTIKEAVMTCVKQFERHMNASPCHDSVYKEDVEWAVQVLRSSLDNIFNEHMTA